jgi:hypothetical protein
MNGLDQEHRRYVRSLLRGGAWELRPATRTGHLKITHRATGRTLAIAGSPGDFRSLRNFKQQVESIEREAARR